MEVFDILRAVAAADVLLHHPGAGYARPDDGAGGYKSAVVLAIELLQQAAHGRTLHVKTADGIAMLQELPDLFIFFDDIHAVYIHVLALVFPDQPYAFVDMADAALAEDVYLLKSELLGGIHIPLHCGHTFWRHVERGITTDGVFRDQYPARMELRRLGKSMRRPAQCNTLAIKGSPFPLLLLLRSPLRAPPAASTSISLLGNP